VGLAFYVITAVWAVAMLAIFIQAIRLSYRIEARSDGLRNKLGVPQKALLVHTALNLKVARDAETQELRRRMLLLLFLNLLGFMLLWGGLWAGGVFESRIDGVA
jgi:hypothetical protein